jgi:AcrR family transcriptional regulator
MTGQERREQLLAVARSVFAEQGFAATSIEDIAERAGVTRPVVYEHFGGKEGIYAVVVDREVTRLSELLSAPLVAGGGSRASAEGAAIAFLKFIEDETDGFRVLSRDAPAGSGRGSFASVLHDVATRTEVLLADTFAQRGYDPAIAPMYARMLVGATAQVGQWWLEVREPDRDTVAAHIINLMWNGLAALDPNPTLHTRS